MFSFSKRLFNGITCMCMYEREGEKEREFLKAESHAVTA